MPPPSRDPDGLSPETGFRQQLEEIFRAALVAVDPAACVRRAIERRGDDLRIAGRSIPASTRIAVLAVGKAAPRMAAAFEAIAGEQIAGGLAVGAAGYETAPLERIALCEAAHPIPDERSERAARAAMRQVASLRSDDVLVVLLSGGASSLLACPAEGLRLDDLARASEVLLAGGAEIHELNSVRKHLSAVSGGRLAALACCRRIEVLAISDVPGDRLDVIGSGPFAPDSSRYADALAVIEARGLRAALPEAVVQRIEAGVRGEAPETLDARDPVFRRVRSEILAGNRDALEAAGHAAAERGLLPFVCERWLSGEARVAGRRLAALADAVVSERPVCLIAGGETAVTVRGSGRGGRNQELALAAALALEGRTHVALLAAASDGIDGPTDAAGAHADGGTVARAHALGRDAETALRDNDSHGFFASEGGLLRTGATGTNVMDLALLRLEPRR